ncbi:uncharacterized protein LOC115898289 isoform X1 [Rhinopithecus roxellana]|uniref:uncharacterized protein LOC115898289 isoform X1 n=1 Tax=Rhinopithecus roxellana TaxID=61622 RepID=UPI0012370D1D|nr:uncharacterized protein LOC115898289 isoform X1 [Rhinopithecus roxellana]
MRGCQAASLDPISQTLMAAQPQPKGDKRKCLQTFIIKCPQRPGPALDNTLWYPKQSWAWSKCSGRLWDEQVKWMEGWTDRWMDGWMDGAQHQLSGPRQMVQHQRGGLSQAGTALGPGVQPRITSRSCCQVADIQHLPSHLHASIFPGPCRRAGRSSPKEQPGGGKADGRLKASPESFPSRPECQGQTQTMALGTWWH